MSNRQIAEYLLDCEAPPEIFVATMLGRRDDMERFIANDSEMIHARGVHDIPLLYFADAGDRPDVMERDRTEIAGLLGQRGAAS